MSSIRTSTSATNRPPLAARATRPARQAAAKPAATTRPPQWAIDLTGDVPVVTRGDAGVTVTVRRGPDATLVSVSVPDARTGVDAFGVHVARAYAGVRSAITASPHPHVVRLWNHLPGIHDAMNPTGGPADERVDRYMTFNAARYTAMLGWYGSVDGLRAGVPAASGVGHAGDSLVVHALANAAPGRSVENPRQVPATQYSARFGPRPPCFARGTVVPGRVGRAVVLVAGTAAITGEASRFAGDLARQFRLSCENVAAVLARASAVAGASPSAPCTLRHVRVYVPPAGRSDNAVKVKAMAAAAFRGAAEIEVVPADLCRRELLVEIEGVAWADQT